MIIPPKLNSTDWNEKLKNGEFVVDQDQILAELQLAVLGDVIPLSVKIDTGKFQKEISKFDNDWCDYLPRTDRVNNRKGLTVTTFPGFSHQETPSLPELAKRLGRPVKEVEMNAKTEVYDYCSSLHPILSLFPDLGRTFLLKCNMGGYFVPHRDHPQLNRDVFRVLVFLNNCKRNEFDFIFDNQCLAIEEGRAYVINTRKTHRAFSFVDNSIQMVMNIPMTLPNVMTVLSTLQHRH